ncbi:MAG: hypothetical protein IK137_01010 [Bacilli bacterium]|nr:hypothetical protein [Bacilli bacterium]
MSDFLAQLQQINFANIVAFLSPTIIYFVAKEPIVSNYKLVKDFKVNSVKPVALPVEVIKKYDEIDEKKVLEKRFGELIIDFAKVVNEKIPEFNWSIFLNNLNTLKTGTKSFKLSNFIYNKNTEGDYSPASNTIRLSEHNYRITITHELFHVATTIYDRAHGIIFCGFEQVRGNSTIGEGINEGYTQYLAEKTFGKENTLGTAYTYEKRIAEVLENIVGGEKMRSLYFNADLSGLIEYLKMYTSEESIHKFINTLDFLNEHMGDKFLLPSSKKLINESCKSVNVFLLQTALRKKIIDSNDSTISTKDLLDELIPIMTLIPAHVKNKEKSSDIFDEELILDALSDVINEYDLSDDNTKITK